MLNIKKIKKGSALVVVILVLFMISAISISILSRTQRNLNMSVGTRKSQTQYQIADQNVEKILNQLKKFDYDSGSLKNWRLIGQVAIDDLIMSFPAGDIIRTLWTQGSLIFKDDAGAVLTGSSAVTLIKDVVINSDNTNAFIRAVNAPLPLRIGLTGPTNVNVIQCGGTNCGSNKNTCNYKISFTYPDYPRAKSFVLKRNQGTSSGYGNFWNIQEEIEEVQLDNEILVNGTNYGLQNIYFAIKAKNQLNYQLDSVDSILTNDLDFPPNESLPANAKCLSNFSTPANTSLCSVDNTCCGDTECYVCNAGSEWADNPEYGCTNPAAEYRWTESCQISGCNGLCGPGTRTSVCQKKDASGNWNNAAGGDAECVNAGYPKPSATCFDLSCSWASNVSVSGCTETTSYYCGKNGSNSGSDSCCRNAKPSSSSRNICSGYAWDKNSCSVECEYNGQRGNYTTCIGYQYGELGRPVTVNSSICNTLPSDCGCKGDGCSVNCTNDGVCMLNSSGDAVCKYPDGTACTTDATCESNNCCMSVCVDDTAGCPGTTGGECYTAGGVFWNGAICLVDNRHRQCKTFNERDGGYNGNYCAFCDKSDGVLGHDRGGAFCGDYCELPKAWSIPSYDGVINSSCECSSQCTVNDGNTVCCSGSTTIGANADGGSGRCRNLQTDVSNCGSCGNAANNSYWYCSSGSLTCRNNVSVYGQPCECEDNCYSESGKTCMAASSGSSGPVCCNSGSQLNCNGLCKDYLTDEANCGSCGHSCGSNETCSGGNCLKNDGQSCSSGGQCLNGHCCFGSCTGSSCPGEYCNLYGPWCYSGSWCSGATVLSPGGTCYIANGNSCSGYSSYCENGNCSNNVCCNSGQTYCDGACRNASYFNNRHDDCGSCGNDCGAGNCYTDTCCTPSCACAASTPSYTTCSDGCGGSCQGTACWPSGTGCNAFDKGNCCNGFTPDTWPLWVTCTCD